MKYKNERYIMGAYLVKRIRGIGLEKCGDYGEIKFEKALYDLIGDPPKES